MVMQIVDSRTSPHKSITFTHLHTRDEVPILAIRIFLGILNNHHEEKTKLIRHLIRHNSSIENLFEGRYLGRRSRRRQRTSFFQDIKDAMCVLMRTHYLLAIKNCNLDPFISVFLQGIACHHKQLFSRRKSCRTCLVNKLEVIPKCRQNCWLIIAQHNFIQKSGCNYASNVLPDGCLSNF